MLDIPDMSHVDPKDWANLSHDERMWIIQFARADQDLPHSPNRKGKIMNFEEAKIFLSNQTRWELRDHAFGDTEFGWNNSEGEEVAGGYSGGGTCNVWIKNPEGLSMSIGGYYSGENPEVSFKGEEARELKKCGTLDAVERNDETGPDTYVEGVIMPSLTKEGVLKEITTPPSITDQLLGDEIDRITNEERMIEAERYDDETAWKGYDR